MRLNLPEFGTPANLVTFVATLTRFLRLAITQVNSLGDGQIAASNNASNAPPIGGSTPYAQGDIIRNSNPTEQGAAGSRYVVTGWICVSAGTPGMWVQCRSLTGN